MQHAKQPPELPSLSPGVQLLESDEHPRTAIHVLVLDHILVNEGDVYWIDSDGSATAHPFTHLAPNERLLERVRIARAQTSTQHYALIDHLCEQADAETSLLVATGNDHFYREHDRGSENAQDLMVRTLAMTTGAARGHDLPVLMTRREADEFSEPLANAAADVITYQETEMGPRFTGEDFETLVYPRRDGFQTTLEYWRRILAARHPTQHTATASATDGLPQ